MVEASSPFHISAAATNNLQLDSQAQDKACEKILHGVGTYTRRTATRSFEIGYAKRGSILLQVSGVEAEVLFQSFLFAQAINGG
jgi:hypothetical protein